MAFFKNFLFKNQNVEQTLAKNASWLLIGEIGSRFLKMFLVLYSARVLGVAGWGTFSYVLSTVFICSFLADAGLGNMITREYATDASVTKYKQAVLSVKLLYLVSSMLIITLVSFLLLRQQGLFWPGILLGAFILIDSLRDFTIAIARGHEKMEIEALAKTVAVCTTTIVGILLLMLKPSIAVLSFSYIVGSLVGLVIVVRYLRPLLRGIRMSFEKYVFVTIAKGTFLYAIIMFTNALMVNEDTLLVGWMKGFHDAGLYAAAQKVVQFILILGAIIVSATLPALSKKVDDPEQFRRTYARILQFLMFIALPLTVGGILLAVPILVLLFGAEYAAAAPTLRILFLSLLSLLPSMILISSALVQRKQGSLVAVNIVGNVLHLALVYGMIRLWGISGAAIATTITLSLVYFMMARKFMSAPLWQSASSFVKSVAALIIMSIAIRGLDILGLHVILVVAIAIPVYLFTLLILREPSFLEYKDMSMRLIKRQS